MKHILYPSKEEWLLRVHSGMVCVRYAVLAYVQTTRGEYSSTPSILASLCTMVINQDSDIVLGCPLNRLKDVRPLVLILVHILPEYCLLAMTVVFADSPVPNLDSR